MPELLTPFIILIGCANIIVGNKIREPVLSSFLISTGLFLVLTIFLSEGLSIIHGSQ